MAPKAFLPLFFLAAALGFSIPTFWVPQFRPLCREFVTGPVDPTADGYRADRRFLAESRGYLLKGFGTPGVTYRSPYPRAIAKRKIGEVQGTR